jgi:hypothetical protein
VHSEIDPTIAAAANVLMVLTTTAFVGWLLLRRRRPGAGTDAVVDNAGNGARR